MLSSSAVLANPAMPLPIAAIPLVFACGIPPGRGCVKICPIICAAAFCACGFMFIPGCWNPGGVPFEPGAVGYDGETPPICEFTGLPGGYTACCPDCPCCPWMPNCCPGIPTCCPGIAGFDGCDPTEDPPPRYVF